MSTPLCGTISLSSDCREGKHHKCGFTEGHAEHISHEMSRLCFCTMCGKRFEGMNATYETPTRFKDTTLAEPEEH
jgi:hypothetical protein